MNQKKIAILFYGRIQNYERCYKNINDEIAINYDIDYFLSHSPELNENVQDFKTLFKPIAICNDPIKYPKNLEKFHKNSKDYNTIPHYINKMRVFNLLEDHINKNKVEYDYIFCTRIDVFYFNNLIFENFTEIDDNTIYIPDGHDWGNPGINDQMAIGNLEGIRKYTSIYNNIEIILEKLKTSWAEMINLENINYMKLNVKRYSRNYLLKINQENYNYYEYYKKKNIAIPNIQYIKKNIAIPNNIE